jgi:hypothetical protein
MSEQSPEQSLNQLPKRPLRYVKYEEDVRIMVRSLSDQEKDTFLEEHDEFLKTLSKKFSRDELKAKCNELLVLSDGSEFDKMTMAEKGAYVLWYDEFSNYRMFQEGFAFIKNMYKNYCCDGNTQRITDDANPKNMLCNLHELSQNKPHRIAVLNVKNHIACADDIPSILKKGRDHSKRPTPNPLIKSKLGDDIQLNVVKDLVFLDQDKPDSFTGFILVDVSYFEKDPKSLGYTNMTEWSNANADLMYVGLFPIDTNQEEFRNMGYILNHDFGKDKKYNTIRIKSSLIKLNEDGYSCNEYLNFCKADGNAKEFNNLK